MSKTIEDKYKKVSQKEHILLRSDTYVGSIDKVKALLWILNEDNQMEQKEITYIPGLFKIFDEIIVNALDHKTIDDDVKNIKVSLNDDGSISVFNDGSGIDIVLHKVHKVYVPELIFGHLLTSTNYDDKAERTTGGRNGLGAKLANIFSTKFIIETVDSERQLKFIQTYYDNMSRKDKPTIKPCKTKSYTKITFLPDYSRFGIESLSDDMISLFKKRVYDACANTPKDVNVYLNDEKLKIKEFNDYVNLYIGSRSDVPRVYQSIDRWDICAAYNESGTFQQVSFVNGINTTEGGTHLKYILDQITKMLEAHIKKGKNKDSNIKAQYIKDHMWLFVKSTIVNPSFSSQTKEILTSKVTTFGSKCDILPEFIKKLAKTDIVNRVLSFAQFKDDIGLKKSDGVKRSKLRNIPKLDDANFAGTVKSSQCTLILVEGDSARTFANSGLSIIGHDFYGVFPLKGKVLNVREESVTQQGGNVEINYIKQILGLQMGKKYETTKSLRYGSIMILTDADDDGTHIKGLIMNLIHFWWPELLQVEGFIQSMVTPVVKATKGTKVIDFKMVSDYTKWKDKNNNGKGWKIKYYKGLGTSTANEAKEYFKSLDQNQLFYEWCDNTTDALCLAFQKDQADMRKDWIRKFDKENTSNNEKITNFHTFINKELIHYSQASVIRSIPAIHDGLKPSQRKILYTAFIRHLINEIKVSQFAGSVSEKSAYHHGEMSLQGCIINMAQTFVGANNINLLYPSGQFGTRLMGGKDSASPRYIFTRLENITMMLFKSADFPLLNQLNDDGFLIEPEWYLPILPTVLVNGAEGIATGFSTKIPQYNPVDIVKNLKHLMKDEPMSKMEPYYRAFVGTITEDEFSSSFTTAGKYEKIDEKTIRITELPIGMWTYAYQEFLETLIIDPKEQKKKQYLKNYINNNTDVSVNIDLIFPTKYDLNTVFNNKTDFEKTFKLNTRLNTTNMYLYSTDNTIKKYNQPTEILEEFYHIRLEYYQKRKDYLLEVLQKDLDIMASKVQFIEDVMNDVIVIFRQKKDVIIEQLEKHNYPTFKLNTDTATYNYLLDMKILTFSEEKLEALKEDRDIKQGELTDLQSKDKYDLWNDDLDEFMKELTKHNKEYEKQRNYSVENQKESKSKKTKKGVKAKK